VNERLAVRADPVQKLVSSDKRELEKTVIENRRERDTKQSGDLLGRRSARILLLGLGVAAEAANRGR
jgi:hypothetical protein